MPLVFKSYFVKLRKFLLFSLACKFFLVHFCTVHLHWLTVELQNQLYLLLLNNCIIICRSKDIESTGFNGTAAFMEVRVQSIVVEFILTHVAELFPGSGISSSLINPLHFMLFSSSSVLRVPVFSVVKCWFYCFNPGLTVERRKSLPSPSILSSHDEPFFKSLPLQCTGNLSPGDGPLPMRPYHAIIDGTDK